MSTAAAALSLLHRRACCASPHPSAVQGDVLTTPERSTQHQLTTQQALPAQSACLVVPCRRVRWTAALIHPTLLCPAACNQTGVNPVFASNATLAQFQSQVGSVDAVLVGSADAKQAKTIAFSATSDPGAAGEAMAAWPRSRPPPARLISPGVMSCHSNVPGHVRRIICAAASEQSATSGRSSS